MIRIFSDENVHADIVSGLRQEGFDLVTAVDSGFAGRKDIELLDYAEKHGLLLLSGDKDFGGLIEFGSLWGRGRAKRGDRYNLINFLLNRIRPENLPPLNSLADDVLQSTRCVDACFSAGRYIS